MKAFGAKNMSVYEKISRILLEKGVEIGEATISHVATISYINGTLILQVEGKTIHLSPFDNLVLTIITLYHLRDVIINAKEKITNPDSKTTLNDALNAIEKLVWLIPRLHEILKEEW